MTVATGEEEDEVDDVVRLPRIPAMSEAIAAAWDVVSAVEVVDEVVDEVELDVVEMVGVMLMVTNFVFGSPPWGSTKLGEMLTAGECSPQSQAAATVPCPAHGKRREGALL